MGFMDQLAAKAAAKKAFRPTPEQQDIFEYLVVMPRGGRLGIKARAGTGKTTTVERGCDYMRRADESNRALFLAFGKQNAAEMTARMPAWVKASTFHSLACRALEKPPAFKKLWAIAKRDIDQFKLRFPAVQLCGLAKNMGVGLDGAAENSLETFHALLLDHGIRFQKRFRPVQVARAGQRLFNTSLQDLDDLDFDDMLYVLARDGFRGQMRPYDWLVVDEFQDTNVTQFHVLDHILALGDGGCRLVFPGDPEQAIYGWRGAGVGSFQAGVERYGADVLPLTVSQRCPKAVIRSAQQLVPDIQAKPDAPEGSVQSIGMESFRLTDLSAGDAVLCRNNAPLLMLALEAIRADMAVNINGKDIPNKVLKVFDRLFFKKNPPSFGGAFSAEEYRLRAEYNDRPMALELALNDLRTAQAVWEIVTFKGAERTDIWEYDAFALFAEKVMKGLFVDPDKALGREGVIFSTVHRAKGMEYDKVWFYKPSLIPSKAAAVLGGWHLKQEHNLDYVARTRSKHTLIFLHDAE